LSKIKLKNNLKTFIWQSTYNFGLLKIVLRSGLFSLETENKNLLARLIQDKIVAKTTVGNISQLDDIYCYDIDSILSSNAKLSLLSDTHKKIIAKRCCAKLAFNKNANSPDVYKRSWNIEIAATKIEFLKQRCLPKGLNYPLVEEYDFLRDVSINLDIEQHPRTTLTQYQKTSLRRVCRNGRARSGIIVLPCGAGKSVTGVSLACIINKPVLILCSNSVSVEQWKTQFERWSILDSHSICRFTSVRKEMLSVSPNVTISTYTMIAFGGKRTDLSRSILNEIKKRKWGLILFDEVHVVPAQIFRTVMGVAIAHCKIGLTGTLVREDKRVEDLQFLIGPKLFEGNWLDITMSGHITEVFCFEVRCPMSKILYDEYFSVTCEFRKQLLFITNPNKIHACQNLIFWHEKAGHKIIIFSDNVFALQFYATKLRRPFICGATPHCERLLVLQMFRKSGPFQKKTLLISKVGDNSIDIPQANVLVQISSQSGSRRQEAQRLGRILRSKKEQSAFFYTMLSGDTSEIYYNQKRQLFLLSQGYKYRIISDFMVPDFYTFHCTSSNEKNKSLDTVLQLQFLK
jgi:DNA excision repair protein ERCC-3